MEQITNNWEENLKNILEDSVIIHKPTLEFLIKQKAKDEIYLFIFYCYCSKLQKNHKKIWASNDFVRQNLKMRKQDLLKAKKQLTEWGIIETIPYKEKAKNSNKKVIKRWFVKIKPLFNAENIINQIKSPEVPSPEVPESRGWKREPQLLLSNNNKFFSNNINNKSMSKQVLTDFSLNTEIEKMLNDKRRHIQIIGLWIKEKPLNPQNKEQLQSIIKRNLRPAKLLEGYSNEMIIKTIKILKETDYLTKFSLETVYKFIDDIVAMENKEKKGKIIKWERVIKNGVEMMKPIYDISKVAGSEISQSTKTTFNEN